MKDLHRGGPGCEANSDRCASLLTIIRIRVHNTHMIVCVCKAVSDKDIRAAVKNGATQLPDLTRELGLGTCCGKCLPEAKTALAASLGQRERAEVSSYFTAADTEFAL
jgi:bacterioferritin-associated ferredoxin